MLWSKTLDSSVWRRESKETRLVWVTMLMMKDSDGQVLASQVGLADRAVVTDEECREALRVLLAPDPNDTSKVEDGRRIRVIPGGWQIINHDLYRFSTDAKREFWKAQKAEQRAAKKPASSRKHSQPLPGEVAAVAAEKRGDFDGAAAIAAAALPVEKADPVVQKLREQLGMSPGTGTPPV
jgi:hypothetical protein